MSLTVGNDKCSIKKFLMNIINNYNIQIYLQTYFMYLAFNAVL